MPLIINNQQHFDEVKAFAEKIGKADDLQKWLDYLDNYNDPRTIRCQLFKDFAPASFGFRLEKLTPCGEWITWFNGGLLYHGPHDGWGSGAAPTLAVTLTPTDGWSIHT